jgi:hypothetical protein
MTVPKIDIQPLGGAELLDEVNETLCRFVIWPDEHAPIAFTLWVAATHAQTAWEHATRFVIGSPVKRCGKTRVVEIGRELVHRPLCTVNISTAALVRSIDEDDPPTLFIDEGDTTFAKRKGEAREGAEDLRGIINSGHSRGWPYLRWDMKTRELEACPTFAMVLVAGIGSMPDTIEDRAVVVTLRRRAAGERVTPFRRKKVIPVLRELNDRLHAWVTNVEGLDDAEPDLPVEDRDADKWEPLVAIADAAGGQWPARARAACEALCGASTLDESTAGERLLADLYEVWQDTEDHLATTTLLDRLHKVDEAPWSDWYGKPFSDRNLAHLLRPYRVKSKTVREAGAASTARGYARADLIDPWTRYTLPNDTSDTATHEDETGPPTCEDGCVGNVSLGRFGSDTPSDLRKQADVSDVSDVSEETANRVRRERHHPRLETLADELDAGTATFEERLAELDRTDEDYGLRIAELRAADVLRRREVQR